ncbi:hypothetical protein EMIHUDRAFT_468343 [Emiliania huxleyi CCMP1516]|uniref:DUF4126 domain-containing protein n=2 Tax=Emiliania huxleyi TaxID=2903 RepID=A0A0D3K4G7_EMIH1|nr:hypothetical protein EMIHUDRAFT_468343 [Emiliania huxleyi CCMP1516]EOD30652.1 hypothetical protein EMIHUDRAFT_468343 [Emiliania huxleyi CCMP1516]|eukprot:XP_005783081.1 hypothetical protein EMIHUDRAFT_468343 [Emiliania huxleyi CCMP1516]
MSLLTALHSTFVGFTAASASGVRATLPLAIMAFAKHLGLVDLAPGYEWLESSTASFAIPLALVAELQASLPLQHQRVPLAVLWRWRGARSKPLAMRRRPRASLSRTAWACCWRSSYTPQSRPRGLSLPPRAVERPTAAFRSARTSSSSCYCCWHWRLRWRPSSARPWLCLACSLRCTTWFVATLTSIGRKSSNNTQSRARGGTNR